MFDSKGDPHVPLLQIGMTPLGPGIPNLATLLFNHPIRGIIPIINRLPNGIDKDEEPHEALVKRQTKDNQNMGTPRNYGSIPMKSTVVVQCEDGDHGPMAL